MGLRYMMSNLQRINKQLFKNEFLFWLALAEGEEYITVVKHYRKRQAWWQEQEVEISHLGP